MGNCCSIITSWRSCNTNAASEKNADSTASPTRLDEIIRRFSWRQINWIARQFLRTFCRDFMLAWTVRGGISLFPSLVKLAQSKQFVYWRVIRSAFGEASLRFGLFVALYFSLFKLIETTLARWESSRLKQWKAFIAGSLASIALCIEAEDTRWTLAQYLLVRALQCICGHVRQSNLRLYNLTKHGDSALFILCSGQLVYGFVCRPHTLDYGYANFLTRVSGFVPAMVDMLRRSIIDAPFPYTKAIEHYHKHGIQVPLEIALRGKPGILNCEFMHPESTCASYIMKKFLNIFKMTFPMYFSLHLIPPLVFKFRTVYHKLHSFLINCINNTLYSATFMTSFVFVFQTLLCFHRYLARHQYIRNREWRYLYWCFGAISAFTIFIEKKQRRAELMLYLAPKAVTAFYRAIKDGRWTNDIPGGDLMMFSIAMGTIMSYSLAIIYVGSGLYLILATTALTVYLKNHLLQPYSVIDYLYTIGAMDFLTANLKHILFTHVGFRASTEMKKKP